MKLYVLSHGFYDDEYPVGIFDSLEAVEEGKEKFLHSKWHYNPCNEEGFRVYEFQGINLIDEVDVI